MFFVPKNLEGGLAPPPFLTRKRVNSTQLGAPVRTGCDGANVGAGGVQSGVRSRVQARVQARTQSGLQTRVQSVLRDGGDALVSAAVVPVA